MQIHSFASSFMLGQLPRVFRLRIACEREISSSYFYTKINENIKKIRGGSLDDPVHKQCLIANLHKKLANQMKPRLVSNRLSSFFTGSIGRNNCWLKLSLIEMETYMETILLIMLRSVLKTYIVSLTLPEQWCEK